MTQPPATTSGSTAVARPDAAPDPAALDATASDRRSWRDALSIYARPKLVAMLLLGFSAGLPFFLVYGTLSAWLREAGVSRTAIGFFVWLGFFYTLKWVWAPLVDRFDPPGFAKAFGRRRAWMLLAQVGLVVGMIGVGRSDPQTDLVTLALFAMLIAFASATQDVAIDAWRIEAVETDAQAAMAANYQLGYRFGLMTAQTGALAIAGAASLIDPATGEELYTPDAWRLAYWVMAALVLVGASTVLWTGEPSRQKAGEGIWPRREGLARNLAVGTAFAGALVVAALIVFRLLPSLGAALTPLGVITGPLLDAVAALPTLAWIAAGLAALATLPRLRRLPPRLAIAAGVAIAVVVYFAFFRIVLAGGSGGEEPLGAGAAALRAAPLLFATAPFAAAVALIPIARATPASAPMLAHPAAGPVMDFLRRYGWAALVLLALVATYRLSDFTMGVMAKPLYIDLGYAKQTMGWVTGVFGLWVGVAGAFAAGLFAMRFGLMRCLVAGAVLTIATNLSFAWLAAGPAETWRLTVAIALDNSAGGFAGGVFIAYMSRLTNTAFTASQYAILSSLYAIYGKTLAGFSGVLADAVGYVWFFVITAGFGIPALLLTFWVLRRESAFLPGAASQASQASQAS